MGEQSIEPDLKADQLRKFEQKLLTDIRALEYLIENGMLEQGVRRIGAEQEVFLVGIGWEPLPIAMEVLERLDDPHFTTEIAKFNLEFNIDPLVLSGACFSKFEQKIRSLLTKARRAARSVHADIMLAGILPTLRKSHLSLENMSPMPRYYTLNEVMTRLRGGEYELFIRGTDELFTKHDSVMLEACNTSFQIHLQVSPEEFARFYNIAQVVAAPALAVAANSPLLFGRRLWRETRIAVFQQSIDTRRPYTELRAAAPRVSFGTRWVDHSVLEIFQEDIINFRVLMGTDIAENPFDELEAGRTPHLKALQVFNSTVYRWNRPCYGLTDGKPHLRIENRIFPAGPSVIDEVANAAFWFGLTAGIAAEAGDVRTRIQFHEAKANFLYAARRGIGSQFYWFNNKILPAARLILQHLLPLAHEGLRHWGVAREDCKRYLSVIKKRVKSGQTGAEWLLNSFESMRSTDLTDKRLYALAAATAKLQQSRRPVHKWPLATLDANGSWKKNILRAEQFMTTELCTVNEEDSVELALNVMNWRRLQHLPVENADNKLVGLLTHRSLIRYITRHADEPDRHLVPVRAVMKRKVTTISPNTTSLEANSLIRKRRLTCLPVVCDGRLVGIVTEHDFMKIAALFLQSEFSNENE